jgi:hypothetical protein
MSSANDDGDDELKDAVSKNETLAEWGGVAVVFGLVVEVALTAAYRHGSIIEAWGPVFADALIALGVAAEILFARKARSKAEVLQRRSDDRVAEAKMTAAQAHERAAVLEKEAADARERTAVIEKLTAWRRITPEQYSSIIRAIRETAPEIDLLVECEYSNAEAFMYARHSMGVPASWGNENQSRC